ncbi:MAG TPA: DUF354 domain-containing protein, partial [Candidatus Binatus sp.]|nr:DUF354 domain-containing protein [Candidatus Binatus sp.]
PNIIRQLGLDSDRPIIVLRTEEAFASYLMGRSSDAKPVIEPVIADLLRREDTLQIVVSTRYGQQAPVLRKHFGQRILVLDRVVDAASLLSETDVFIGSGGTMTVEAALLGVPAISCFPGPKPLYISYLESKELVKTIKSPRRIGGEVITILSDDKRRERQKRLGRSLLDSMENPTDKILDTIEMAHGAWEMN